MLRAVLPAVCGLLLACSGQAARGTRTRTPGAASAGQGAAHDPVRELAAALPVGADRCVLVRTARAPEQRASLLARVSQAEPFAWLAELGVEAYASALLERRNGPAARVSLLWLKETTQQVRDAFDARAGIALRWDDKPCTGGGCPPRAQVLDGHVLRIEQHAFPIEAEPGASVQCARMAAAAPDALELSFARSRRLLDELVGVPLRTKSTIALAAHGVHVSREQQMLTAAESQLAYQQGVMAEERGIALAWLATDLRVERVDSALLTDFDVLWDDLELAAQDDLRTAAAEREAAARDRVELTPGEPPDLRSREGVLAQLAFRLDRAERAGEPERALQLSAARELLAAACAAQPDDEGLALLHAELVIGELNDGAAGRVLAREGGARFETRARWQALERRAAAMLGEAALASTLGAQRIARGRAANELAREILEQLQSGSSYDDAERAVLPDNTR